MLNNLCFRTIVFLQDDESRIGIGIMEVTDIFRIGSLELIDRLIIITDSEDIWILRID